jgi:hypothetical protein
MSHWPYIIASYALTIGGMAGLALVSWLRMVRAEKQAEALSPSRSSRAQSRGAGAESEHTPLDFARDERNPRCQTQ